MSSFDQITAKFKELLKLGKVEYATKHIETDRKYREISIQDIRAVLSNGKVSSTGLDGYIEWVGKDIDQREIKLICRMRDTGDNNTLNVLIAEEVIVGTAYQPKLDDDALRAAWLLKNPEWRANSQGHVERKNGK